MPLPRFNDITYRVTVPLRAHLSIKDFTLFTERSTILSKILVIVVPPRLREVHLVLTGRHAHVLPLSFPYMVFLVEIRKFPLAFADAYAFYRNEPLDSPKAALYQCNLPNMLADERVCMGDMTALDKELKKAMSSHDMARCFLEDFWHRPFSDHAMGNFRACRSFHPALDSYASWAAESRRDPGFITRVQWRAISALDFELKRLAGGI